MDSKEQLDLPDSPYRHPYNFEDTAFGGRILKGLNELRLARKFFDMTICVGEQRYMCHRAVLASASDYFRGMFGGMMRESFTDTVTIFDVDSFIMDLLIQFCYTGQVEISTENVERLLQAADLFQFPTIKRACSDFLATNLHPSNCLNIARFAEGLCCYDLAEASFNYTLQHIVEVTQTRDYANLDFEKVLQIISHQDLNVDKEEDAYEICLYWIKLDAPRRIKYFETFVKHIKFPFIRRIYILTKIEVNVLVRNSQLCREFIKDSKDFHNCNWDRHECPSVRMQPRPSTGIAEVLIVLGGCDNNCDKIVNVDCLNPKANRCRYLAEPPDIARGGFSAVVLDNDIFLTGGSDGFRMFENAWRYKSQLNEWIEIPPMLQPREYHDSVSLKNSLYVISAEGCERFDLKSDSWSMISPLQHPVSNCSVASCCGKIYCIGSAVLTNAITLQVYHPDTDVWKLLECNLSYMCQSSFVPSITSLSGMLYFIYEDLKHVIAYDPTEDTWLDRIAPMLQLHLGGSIAQYEGKLVASGGYDERFGLSDMVEVYNPEKNTWNMLMKLPQPMFWHNCVSLFRYVSAPRGDNFLAPPSLHDFTTVVSNGQDHGGNVT